MTDDWLKAQAADMDVPAAVDTSVAHQARIYDYWLGGKDNFAADREAAEQAVAAYPPILRGVRAQRAFLARAVRYLAAEAGIRQFLDIGTGIPTANNTHEVARRPRQMPGPRPTTANRSPPTPGSPASRDAFADAAHGPAGACFVRASRAGSVHRNEPPEKVVQALH